MDSKWNKSPLKQTNPFRDQYRLSGVYCQCGKVCTLLKVRHLCEKQWKNENLKHIFLASTVYRIQSVMNYQMTSCRGVSGCVLSITPLGLFSVMSNSHFCRWQNSYSSFGVQDLIKNTKKIPNQKSNLQNYS